MTWRTLAPATVTVSRPPVRSRNRDGIQTTAMARPGLTDRGCPILDAQPWHLAEVGQVSGQQRVAGVAPWLSGLLRLDFLQGLGDLRADPVNWVLGRTLECRDCCAGLLT